MNIFFNVFEVMLQWGFVVLGVWLRWPFCNWAFSYIGRFVIVIERCVPTPQILIKFTKRNIDNDINFRSRKLLI